VSGQVATGEDAIQAVQKEEPDIILMDIHLGGKIDGLQAASQSDNSVMLYYCNDWFER